MDELTFDSATDDVPLSEPLVFRHGIVTFASDFRDGFPPTTDRTTRFLRSLSLTSCAYGAAECRVYPLLLSLEDGNPFQTGRDVLKAVKARDFKSEHIQSLDEREIPFPGYHPDTDNDEVHTDPLRQHIFSSGEDSDGTTVVHEQLRDFVANRQLWYVLLHMKPKRHGDFMFSEYVVLFGVGKVLGQPYVAGVVTHQVCHNLCD